LRIRKKTAKHLSISKNQFEYFDRFLVASTRKTLEVLETMFSLNIESSDSSIKILPTVDVKHLELLSSDPLFVISSEMTGEMHGRLKLLMSKNDFTSLGEALKPTLKLLFLSSPDADLSTLEDQTPKWMEEGRRPDPDDSVFLNLMMDTSTELGNILFGIYTDTIYEVFDLHTHHSLPEFSRDNDHQYIQEVLSSPGPKSKQHMLIQNDFTILENHFALWCLISPSKKSLQTMLDRVG